MKQAAASAIVLAGGRSSRMGRPKATLEFGGRTLVERIVAELGARFDDVVVVAAPQSIDEPRFPQLAARIVRDREEYRGPAAGLMHGLRDAHHEVAFACACDLPWLKAEVAHALCAMLGDHDALVPEVGGRLQPLHGVWRRGCADTLASMIARGERRLLSVLPLLDVRVVGEAELREIDPRLASFSSISTPEEYRAAVAAIGPQPPR